MKYGSVVFTECPEPPAGLARRDRFKLYGFTTAQRDWWSSCIVDGLGYGSGSEITRLLMGFAS